MNSAEGYAVWYNYKHYFSLDNSTEGKVGQDQQIQAFYRCYHNICLCVPHKSLLVSEKVSFHKSDSVQHSMKVGQGQQMTMILQRQCHDLSLCVVSSQKSC